MSSSLLARKKIRAGRCKLAGYVFEVLDAGKLGADGFIACACGSVAVRVFAMLGSKEKEIFPRNEVETFFSVDVHCAAPMLMRVSVSSRGTGNPGCWQLPVADFSIQEFQGSPCINVEKRPRALAANPWHSDPSATNGCFEQGEAVNRTACRVCV